MPKVEVEILRTVTVTREEKAVVELDVPEEVLADEEIVDWIDQIMEKDDDGSLTDEDRTVYAAVVGADWNESDTDEETEYDEAYKVG